MTSHAVLACLSALSRHSVERLRLVVLRILGEADGFKITKCQIVVDVSESTY